jgi:SAM-dependent methyltransferase
MLGAGNKPPKRSLGTKSSAPEEETVWITLDIIESGKPDFLFDLNQLRHGIKLPFKDEEFDEIHAYEVLEHVGRQGDWRGFFREFKEYWRILKPGGYLIGTSPAYDSRWKWGDPGHARVFSIECLGFLKREMYSEVTEATDYSTYVDPCWWEIRQATEDNSYFTFCLEKSS